MTVTDISRSLTISGWMGDTELEWLAQQARRCRTVVEVGCWVGRSTVALAQHCPGTVWAVDTWEGSSEHAEELKGKPRTWLWDEFRRHTAGLSNIKRFPMPSLEAARILVGMERRYDLIFLDASHDYPSVRADILAWRPLLAPGGLLCGHDLRDSWPGVRQAVEELVPGWRKVPGDRNSIWYAPPKEQLHEDEREGDPRDRPGRPLRAGQDPDRNVGR